LLRKESFNELQPKFSLRYKPIEELTLFASFGRGFRSGGFNGAGLGARVQLQAPDTNFPDAFPEETSDAYELGFKSQWLDGRLGVSGALFYTDIEDAQAFTAFPAPPITIVISLDKVRSQGAELDISFHLTDNLRISNSFGITDTKIKETSLAAALGKKIPGTPDYTNTLSIDYDRQVAYGMTLLSHLDWQQIGPMWFDVYNTNLTQRDAFGLVNARVALEKETGSGTWQLAGWVMNLNDKEYNVYSAPVPPFANFSYRAAPRSYGVDLIYKF
jgi:iron complex outermembrane receptor protein